MTPVEPIALIGIGCRFPGGANNPEAFWQLLRSGVDAVVPIPPSRWDVAKYYDPDRNAAGKMYMREGGFLRDKEITHFDPAFFRMAPREAASLDPQQRLLLEVSWEALEHAGQAPSALEGSLAGVFVGSFWDDYTAERFYHAPFADVDAFATIAGLRSMAAGRIAHALNWHGPAMQVDTACSSSLVAVHMACGSLRSRESNLALAGGVTMMLSPRLLVGNSRMNALATSGRCRAFAAETDGFGRGEGCGMVVLKRYADAVRDGDPILACIRGSAVNHGGRGLSLTTPSVEPQQAVIRMALAAAGVEPAQIQYLEAHGTGTPLGDPVEMAAIGKVFGPARETPLLVGSVKTNIAHLDPAAGVSGLIKVVLSLQHGEIPGNLHFDQPNPRIPWKTLPITIPTSLTPWVAERKLAGVSAFGLSGTNSHVIVEEAPSRVNLPSANERPFHLLPLSGKTPQALHDLAARYNAYFDANGTAPLADICYTAAAGRSHFEHRVALLVNSTDQMRELLKAFTDGERAEGVIRLRRGQEARKPRIAFLFTGQGSQYLNMGRQLYATHPLFRSILDKCSDLLGTYLDEPLTSVLYPESPSDGVKLAHTIFAQPALFAIEYALAQLWRSWGIEPDVVIGHSTGEYAAACVAGVFSLEDGLRLVVERARLIESVSGSGATAAVLAGAEQVGILLEPYAGQVGIAGVNGPLETLIAGHSGAVEQAIGTLTSAGLECRRLQIPHAPHSPLMDPILDDFEAIARQVTYQPPTCKFVSNVTGAIANNLDAAYWRRHLREPVRFADGMAQLVTAGCNIMLEVGPQPVLQLLGRQNWTGPKGAAWLSSLWSANQDWAQLLECAGELYVRGAKLDWARFEREAGSIGSRRKVPLPTYPFQRERHWTEAPSAVERPVEETHPLPGRPLHSAALASGELLFERSLSVNSPAYLKDHRAHEQVLMPAAAYLEMAVALGWQQLLNGPLVIENVSFERALLLPEDGAARRVQCLATAIEDGLRWQVFSADDSSIWTRHAEGSVRTGENEPQIDNVVLEELQLQTPEAVDPATLYEQFGRVNLQYGQQFRLIRRLWRSGDRALGEIQLTGPWAGENEYSMHPALLDACLQVSALLFLSGETPELSDEMYLPTGIERFAYYGRNIQERMTHLWCSAELRSAEFGILTIDLNLYDKRGESLGRIQGLEVRKVATRSLATDVDWRRWLYQATWQLQEVPRSRATERPGHWLMVPDTSGLIQECANSFTADGHQVTVAALGDYRPIIPSIPALTGVVYGGADCGGLLTLIQALAEGGTLPPLYIVTAGAVACGPQQPLAGLAQSPLWGMAKAIPLEYPESTCVCIDVDPGASLEESAAPLTTELTAKRTSGKDEQIAYRRRLRYVSRLATHVLTDGDEGYRWDVAERGRPETLRRVPMPRRKPVAGEIEIELHAAGLNFRDVLTALDLYPGDPGAMGLEGAGTVVASGSDRFAVGDRVMVIAPGCFGRYQTVDARLAAPIPEGLKDAEAATIPSGFVTAWHCLHHLAGIKRGDRVLIHTATGGVGQAAIQLAQLAGAEIYATASPAKWPVLEGLGVRHIYNSRTLEFSHKILEDTAGQGVDIVLNTLTTPGFIDANLDALAKGGCFLEISKRNVHTTAQMASARSHVRYYLVDQAEIVVREPDLVQQQLAKLTELFTQRKLSPLPRTTFAMQDMAGAFRTMEQAAHTGKIVLVHPRARAVEFDSAATYLITGGVGGWG